MFNTARGWLSRLRKDTAGNILAMGAVALIPLIAAVGGTIDASRYYMATARLQNACDAGALAARKAMGDNEWTQEDENFGLNFFDHNYPDETFGLANMTRDYTADEDGMVTGTASGALPTTLMQIFGYGSLDINVSCAAEINVSNTDILFVLDVTGSMNDAPDGSRAYGGGEHSNAKIKGLRSAVLSFYDAVDDATSSTAQVRYGIVPYSSGINVGASIPTDYMATSAKYQTRVPLWKNTGSTEVTSFTINSVSNRGSDEYWYYWYNPSGEYGVSSSGQCDSRAANSNLGFTDSYIEDSIQQNTIEVVSETTNGTTRTRVINARGRFSKGVPIAWYNSRYNPRCYVDLRYSRYYADFQATIVEDVEETQEFDKWRYQQYTWNVADMYTNGSVVLPTGNNGTNQTHNWDGCIEEAATTKDSTFDPLPDGAYDLNINTIPVSDEQRWKPTLPQAVYKRRSGYSNTLNDVTTSDNNSMSKPDYYCPKAAIRLGQMDRTALENYLSYANGFRAQGYTYHDIGMIWGARFISPSGIFAADNATAPNGDSIGRHIVFMTDGELFTRPEVYSPYGIQWWDRRVTDSTSESTLQDRHAARFQAACRQARAENISVWVIAFGTSLDSNLTNCATSGRAFQADDSEELEDAFKQIAQRIAALRLTD